jgi:hypothetical protein
MLTNPNFQRCWVGKLKYNLKTLSPSDKFSGSWENDPAERTADCCRPLEPEPDNTGGGKKIENTN